jgi:hypothetical protein
MSGQNGTTAGRMQGAAGGLAIGVVAGLALSCGAPASTALLAMPLDPPFWNWAIFAAGLYVGWGLLLGALVGIAAGAIRPAGYGRLWYLTAWAGATVGLLVAKVRFDPDLEEQAGRFQLTAAVGMLGGATLGFLLGAVLGTLLRGRAAAPPGTLASGPGRGTP